MLETLITSKTRIKLLLKFFLNQDTTAHLRGLEDEFNESSNAIRIELNRFEKAGLLLSTFSGNKKIFSANTNHPLYNEINSLIKKYIGLDEIVEHIINNLGSLEEVYVTGSFARGIDSDIIDLIFIGKNLDTKYLLELIEKAEKYIKRKIRYIVFSPEQFNTHCNLKNSNENESDRLLIWKA